MKKKIIAAVALLAVAWAGIFGLAACGKKPEPVKVEAPYVVTKTVHQADAKPAAAPVKKKHRPQRKVVPVPADPKCQDFDAICHLINR
jgi:hypothetical protein